jgi:hypothetical protein
MMLSALIATADQPIGVRPRDPATKTIPSGSAPLRYILNEMISALLAARAASGGATITKERLK